MDAKPIVLGTFAHPSCRDKSDTSRVWPYQAISCY